MSRVSDGWQGVGVLSVNDPMDVLVVGGGPSGAVAATALARRGLRTLVVDAGERVASYDVILSSPARHALRPLGERYEVHVRDVSVLDLWFGSQTRRQIADAGMAVCDLPQLRESLLQTATEAGAGLLAGKVTDFRPTEHGQQAVLSDGSTIAARHIVVAAGPGASRRLGSSDGAGDDGRLMCARRFSGIPPQDRVLLQMVTPATNDPKVQPSCAWLLPGSDGHGTIGVTGSGADPDTLINDALAMLRTADPRLAAARPAGPVTCAPVDSGFAPEHAVSDGRLLIGDAAGLVNPFTGEGISYAVQSGLLAAEAIARQPDDPAAAARRYTHELTRAFVGYFETARHAARRYHLAWRVLADTAESDHPFFTKGRLAILLPEGIAGVTAAEPVDLPARESLLVRPFLAGCDEVSVTTIRREWPFIARMLITGAGPTHRQLRPAILLFAGLMAGGTLPDIGWATLGSAVELASLGGLAFLGPAPPVLPGGRGVDWGSATTVLAGDFLLAQACTLVARSAPEMSWSFSEWLAEMTTLRAQHLDGTPGASATDVFAAMFEYPLRAGAQLGAVPDGAVPPLREFGQHCGRTFLYAEDVLALRGKRTRLDTSLPAMLAGRVSTLPGLLDMADLTADRLAEDPQVRQRALVAASTACRESLELGLKAAAEVAGKSSARILRSFIEAAAAPTRQALV